MNLPKTNIAIKVGTDEIATIEVNDAEKAKDLSDSEVQAEIGKRVCELILSEREAWLEKQNKVQEACDCFAKQRDYPENRLHSSGCASWDIE